ncbi:hypothetical protein OG787_17230 [Streptomyces sp. NBC_00075]|uniref:Uncharacterized protein n=1 Tax=Streptomyces sp. NBC_00093 TaxID=2975649 RepID=A0AAU1ZXB5_9ACTN
MSCMAGAGADVRGRVVAMSVGGGSVSVGGGSVSRVYGDDDTLWPKRGLV